MEGVQKHHTSSQVTFKSKGVWIRSLRSNGGEGVTFHSGSGGRTRPRGCRRCHRRPLGACVGRCSQCLRQDDKREDEELTEHLHPHSHRPFNTSKRRHWKIKKRLNDFKSRPRIMVKFEPIIKGKYNNVAAKKMGVNRGRKLRNGPMRNTKGTPRAHCPSK